MPLKWLDLYGVRDVTDLVPLEGMPLEYLNVTGAAVDDSNSLGSLKALQILLIDDTRITDLGALRELRLERISLLHTAVTDLTPLQGMSLKQIRIDRPTEYQIGPPLKFAELGYRDGADVLREFIYWKRYEDKGLDWFDQNAIFDNVLGGQAVR
jgi:hypothetical protein